MKTKTQETICDLNMLIDISCLNSDNVKLFKNFHNLLISLAYKATDVEIQYKRKRIYMNVLFEDIKGDYLIKYDDLMLSSMSTNLYYNHLKHFLKSCIKNEKNMIIHYKSLKSKFLEGNAKAEKDFKVFDSVI